jgi:hypothetical protein
MRVCAVLPLYILLLATFAPALWLMVRKPALTLAGSMAVYFAARHFGWNLPTSPLGFWYFNAFAWQLLFVLGAWTALAALNSFNRSFEAGACSVSRSPTSLLRSW